MQKPTDLKAVQSLLADYHRLACDINPHGHKDIAECACDIAVTYRRVVQSTPEDAWRCAECGGGNLSAMVWADPNTAVCTGIGSDVSVNNASEVGNHCHDCDKTTSLVWVGN